MAPPPRKGPGEPVVVDSLVKAIKAHKGFKQMAQYNISCLLTHITPPAVGWQENVVYAVQSGAIESLIEVLRLHPTALEVVRAAIEALRRLAMDAKYAEAMARAGAVQAALDAMLKSGDDGVAESGADLLNAIAAASPNAILSSKGAIPALLDALSKSKNTRVLASVLATLERVTRTDEGAAEVRKAGGIAAILATIGKGKETTEDMLKPAFRMLDRFARDPAAVKEMKQLGALEALVAQLEAHADNDAVLRAGGKLLAAIAMDDLENIIARLNDSKLSPETRSFMTGLIANLALRPENIDKIVKMGGIKALVNGFSQFSDEVKTAAARALGRLATQGDEVIDKLIKEGAVEALTAAMGQAGSNDVLAAAMAQALANMVRTKDHAKALDERGAPQAVLKKFKEMPHRAELAEAAINLFENEAKAGYDMTGLVSSGIVKAIIEAMRASPMSSEVQLRGFCTLEHLLRDPAQGGKTGQKVAVELHGCGGVPVMSTSLGAQARNGPVVEAGFRAFLELLTCDPKATQKACAAANTIKPVVSAGFAQILQGNRSAEEVMRPVVSKLVTVKEAEALGATLKKSTGVLCATKSEDAADKFDHELQSSVVFSKVKPLCEAAMKAGLGKVVLDAMHDLLQVEADVPRSDELLETNALAVIHLGRSDKKHLKALVDAQGVKIVQEPAKQLTKDRPVAAALKALRVFASPPEYKKLIVEENGVETCVTAMRGQPIAPIAHTVHEPALDVLLQVCAVDELAAATCTRGATRQIIKTMTDNAPLAEFERAMELSLLTLEKVAGAASHHKTIPALVKQGAVAAVILGMDSFPRNETIETVGARLLAKLLDREGVAAAVDNFAKVADKLKATKDGNLLPEYSRAVATMGYLGVAPENKELMRSKNAAAKVMDSLKTLDGLPDSVDATSKAHARGAALRALGQLASADPEGTPAGAIEAVLAVLKNPNASAAEKRAALECIRNLAGSEKMTSQLVASGAAQDIVNLMKANPHDEALMTAGLGALAALAQHEAGAKAVTKAGGRDLVLKWMKDHGDTASAKATEAALLLMSNLALVDENVPELLKGGVVEMLLTSLDNLCSDPANPQPRVLQAAVTVMGRVANSEAAVKELVGKGAIKRAIEIARSSPGYMGDAEAMEALIFLLESCALVDSVRPDLLRAGAAEMIMEAMNLNSAKEDVVVTGARALQALMGSSEDTIKQILKDISDLAKRVQKNPNDRDAQDMLERALENLANLCLVPGLVDSRGAGEISHALCDVLGILAGLPNDVAAKNRLIAKGAQALGRLPLVEGVTFDESEALKRLIEMLRQSDDPAVLEHVLLSLAGLLSGPKALKALTALGGLGDIYNVLAANSDDPRLKEAAEKVLGRAMEIAENDPASLDPATLQALLKSVAGDATALRALLKRMALKGGIPVLMRAFAAEGSGDLSAELLRALRENGEGRELEFATNGALNALLEALKGVSKKPATTAAEKLDLLARQKEALKALGLMGKKDLLELARNGGLEALLKMMMDNIHDPDMVLQCLDAMNRMFDFDPDLLSKLLGQHGAVDKIKEVLKVHGNDPAIVKAALDLLNKMAKKVGVDKLGADEELLRIIAGLKDKYGMELGNDDLLDQLRGLFGEGTPEMIGASLDRALLAAANAADIEQRVDDDGKVYYYDKKKGEKTFTKPAAYASVISAMEGLAKLTEANKESIQAVSAKALTGAVGQLGAHSNDPARLTALAKALAVLASNGENRAAIAKAGGLQAILQALGADNLDKDFVDAALSLLLQFSKNDEYRDQIARLGGIKALIQIMLRFIDNKSVVDRCLSALANLAFNSTANVGEIITHGGIPATLKVMAKWKDEPVLMQNSLVLINNLMHGSDEIKLRVGRECSPAIVDVCARHRKDARTFNAANRAIGNLSVLDPNIRLLVDAHSVRHIVAGMETHPSNVEVLQVAIDVIGNFASLSDDPDHVKIARGEMQSVFDIIIGEGGAFRIIQTIKDSTDVTLLVSGFDALANLAEDSHATQKLLKMGVVPLVINAMTAYDWDAALMARTVRLLATLTLDQQGIKEMVAKDGIRVALSAMESNMDEPEVIKYTVMALKNISNEPDARAEIEKQGGIGTVLTALERHVETQRALVVEILYLFIRMSQNKAASEQIAMRGMHLLLKAIHGRRDDPDFLTRCFILLGHLAFHDPNLKVITQYGGVTLIIEMLCDHAESRELVLRAIQTLDNIAMASQEHSKIVKDEGAVDAIKLVATAYAADAEVASVCKSALLTMQALETRSAKPRRQFLPGQNDEPGYGEDPLKDHRNLLKAGTLLTEWSNGGPNSRHLFVEPDWKDLCWKEPKKTTSRAMTMPLRDIRLVRSGAGDGHKRFQKKAKDNCSFSIVGRALTLDFETQSEAECKAWVAALGALLHCVRRDQRFLKG